MKDIYYKIIFGILIPASAVIFSLYGIGPILKIWRKKIKSHIETPLDFSKFSVNDSTKKQLADYRDDALAQAFLIENRSSGLSFLTKTASLIELITFSVLTLILLYNTTNTNGALGVAKVFGAFLGGWLGIKVLVGHSAWSDPYVGKGYYYISLFGTLINITTAVLVSLFLYHFVF